MTKSVNLLFVLLNTYGEHYSTLEVIAVFGVVTITLLVIFYFLGKQEDRK